MEPLTVAANTKGFVKNAVTQGFYLLLSLGIFGFICWYWALKGRYGIGVLFFGANSLFRLFGFVRSVVFLLRGSRIPALTLDAEGVHDGTGFLYIGGSLRWEELTSTRIDFLGQERLLFFHVRDVEAYLARLPNWKRHIEANLVRQHQTAFVLNQKSVSLPLEEVQVLVEQARQRFAPETAVGAATPKAPPASVVKNPW